MDNNTPHNNSGQYPRYAYSDLSTKPLIADAMHRFKSEQQPIKLFLRNGNGLNGVITAYDDNHFILVGNAHGQPTINIVALDAVATFCLEG